MGTSKSNFTPGPWQVIFVNLPFPDYLIAAPQEGYAIADVYGWKLKNFNDNKLGLVIVKDLGIAEANARLIAGAPELLEGLKLLMDDYLIEFGETEMYLRAKTAIAKAEGAEGRDA